MGRSTRVPPMERLLKENLRMQNYDGQFKLNGQEYFYRAKDDSGSSKITRDNNEEPHKGE